MQQNFVIGYYGTQFGELWNKSLANLIEEAIFGAIEQAKLEVSNIDAIFFGNMLSGILDNNLHLGAKISQILGRNIPIFRTESACASGGMAFHLANRYLDAGACETVLVLGAEKMTDYDIDDITTALASAASSEEQYAGLTFPGLYGILAQSYLSEFNYTEESLAHIAVKNHYHGSFNEKGQFRNKITVDQVLKSGYVAEPLKVLDCSPISDGAAAVVLTSNKIIAKERLNIQVLASEVASDCISLEQRESLLELKSTKIAAEKAFKKSKVKRDQIKVIEIHDCFTIAEILALEDLGFWKRGQGGKEALKQKTKFDDNNGFAVNTSGGLKASGHPVGATGIKQIGEIFLQLTSAAGKRQVQNAEYGLAHNVGGSGGTAVVHIFKK
jgi:acetyl-CoA C-acetyltransferase